MSNALAIAAVTRVLQDLLNNAMVDNNVTGAIGGNVNVSALPPDRVVGENGAVEESRLNLFLHQVTPNTGWRNVDLPTRDHRGTLVETPLLALDLHYLLTAYGADELHAEILLGYAMQVLHETAVLSRDAIRQALSGTAVNGSILPPAFQSLTASDLADQVELIKITPEAFSTDDMSKVWTALQTHYRTTAAYGVSVVLIESRVAKRSPLPVLTRGEPIPATGRDAGVAVQANLLPPFPTLTAISPANGQPAARMGETITLTGHHLDGDAVNVRFVDPRTREAVILPVVPGRTAGQVRVALPPDPPPAAVPTESPLNPENWRAGIYTVSALVAGSTPPARETNELPMVLAPTLAAVSAAAGAGSVTTFTVTCRPPVRAGQRASLIVGQREIPAIEPFAADPTAQLTFQGTGFASGTTHPVRLRIDGADSILVDRSVSPPVFDASQQVTIP